VSGQYYIIMADIVNSSGLKGQGKQLMSQFRDLVAALNAEHAQDILSPLTITLGDEFQGVAASLPAAISILIASEESRIRKDVAFSLRYVVNYGEIETPINVEVAHEMVGEGLTGARRCLEAMKSNRYAHFELELAETDPETLLQDALTLFFGIVQKWKQDDYPLIAAFLDGHEYKRAAELVGRERTSTLRKYRSLRIDEYFACERLLRALSGVTP